MIFPLDPAQPVYGYQPAGPDAPPAVSIVTPYYNTGPLFLETVRSVLRQSLQQWEWLIVNDGSTDAAALRTLLPLRSGDARIRVLDQPNRGLPGARNAGVQASRAPLLFFLDSDDLLAPTALEKLAWTLASRPASAFAGSWTAVFGAERLLWRRGFDTRHAFLHDNTTSPLAMVRRAALDRAGGFDEARRRGLEDYEFWLRCAAAGMWGHDVREPLVWLRRKPAASYTAYRWEFQDDQDALPRFRREMRAAHPELFRRGLPSVAIGGSFLSTHALVETALPFDNRLARPDRQRRILMLLPWMRTGGSEQFALDLAAGLIARGDRVSVALTRDDVAHTWLPELQRITPDVFDLPAFLRPADFPRFLHYLVASRQITHVWVSNSILGYQLLPYLRAHCPHVAFVDYNHLEQEQRSGGLPRVGLEHSALLDMHIVASEHLRAWMLARGAEPGRVAVSTINIDAARFAPDAELRARVRGELGVPDDTPVILFAARLSAEKRARLAADVLRRLRDEGHAFLALFAGGGEDAPWLRLFVARHRLRGQVRLLGPVPNARVRELLAASDIFFLPSEREGIALALYEALAAGVAALAADVGGQRELMTPEAGVLVPPGPGEAEQYLAALRRLVADPAERRRMGRAGRERVLARFSHGAMLDRVGELLDAAAMSARETPRPAVDPGVALAVATLAVEHYQLESRLRATLPLRIALRLRHSSFARAAAPLRGALAWRERLDRAVYAGRREVMWRVKRLLGRPHNR